MVLLVLPLEITCYSCFILFLIVLKKNIRLAIILVSVTQRPALPGDILISDAFLNNLIQICSVSKHSHFCRVFLCVCVLAQFWWHLFIQIYTSKYYSLSMPFQDYLLSTSFFETTMDINCHNSENCTTRMSAYLMSRQIDISSFMFLWWKQHLSWMKVEWQPFTCLTAPAHRIGPGQANNEDGSLQVWHYSWNTVSDNFSFLRFSIRLWLT